ncbi:StbB family protein, partial [Chromobacterium amazonense]|uniref:StbB family protein n=1 Tax=Chromobacterium amazonense TaxID=1382803 RepID=UPI003F78F772
MNIAIINFSGNVGKSTIAKHLLAPRLQAPIIAIESINAGNENEEGAHFRFRGNEFDHFQATLMRQDRAIIDIGASNVEDFMRLMNQYVDSHGEFDLFVVPVVPEKKQQFDTVNTIESLKSLGIPPEKIVTVFNKVDVNQLENLESLFSIVFGFYHASQAFRCEKEAVIVNNDIFETIRHLNKSVDDIA